MQVRVARGSKLPGVGCLIVFALPFAAVGLGMAGWALLDVFAWQRMKSWQETPARIEHAELKVDHGDDSVTYWIEARYAYTYEGRDYTGTRIGLHGGSDNIGDFHQRAAALLGEHVASGKPYTCYVNPDSPEDAVLFRDLRLEMLGFQLLFGVVFGGVGIGLMVFAVFGSRRAKEEAALETGHPEEPWLWKPDWRAGVIKSSNRSTMIGSLVFAGLWNAICIPVLLALPWKDVRDEPAMLFMLLFPLAGVGLALWAARCAIRWRKFGETTFQMASVPGVIGGALDGIVRIPAHIQPMDGFQVRLCSVNRRTTGSGKNRSTKETTLWSADSRVPLAGVLSEAGEAAIPVHFVIPYDQRQTSESDPNNRFLWRLEVKGAVPGVDYAAQFEAPVFHTRESREDVTSAAAALAHARGDLPVAQQLAAAGIDVLQTDTGVRFVFGMGRLWQAGMIAILVGTVFLVAGLLLGTQTDAPAIIGFLFPPLGGLVLFFGVKSLFSRTVVDVDSNGVTCRSSLFGIGRTVYVPREEAGELSHGVGITVNGRPYYDVYLERTGGGKVRVGRSMASEGQAIAYEQVILSVLGR